MNAILRNHRLQADKGARFDSPPRIAARPMPRRAEPSAPTGAWSAAPASQSTPKREEAARVSGPPLAW